ncbi:hypothetical protein K474DRAFT_1607600, partial [Panus rudis PR-1116 ss-1]
FIQNAGTGTVIDLPDGDSPKTQGYTKRSLGDPLVPTQLWVVTGDEPIYTIENTSSRTFMDLAGGDATIGTPIIGYKQTGQANQQWRIIPNTKTTAYITGPYVASSQQVDMYVSSNKANGTPVNGWTGIGATTTNDHQLWKFVVPA